MLNYFEKATVKSMNNKEFLRWLLNKKNELGGVIANQITDYHPSYKNGKEEMILVYNKNEQHFATYHIEANELAILADI